MRFHVVSPSIALCMLAADCMPTVCFSVALDQLEVWLLREAGHAQDMCACVCTPGAWSCQPPCWAHWPQQHVQRQAVLLGTSWAWLLLLQLLLLHLLRAPLRLIPYQPSLA